MSAEKHIVAHHDDAVLANVQNPSSYLGNLSRLQGASPVGMSPKMQPGPQHGHLSTGGNNVFYNQLPYPHMPVASRNNQLVQSFTSTLPPGDANGKRKCSSESEDRSHTAKMPRPHQDGPGAFFTPTMALDRLHGSAPFAGSQNVHRPSLSGLVKHHGTPYAVSIASPHTPPTGVASGMIIPRHDTPVSAIVNKTKPQSGIGKAVVNVKQEVSTHPVVKKDPLMKLDFIPDLYSLNRQHLYFLTVGDRLKAEQRGFRSSVDVYKERIARPSIDTIDINLAWIPPPTYEPALPFPWQPICGPAAYIALVRGDMKAKFKPEEIFYFNGKRIPDTLDIPMLHHIRTGLWYREEPCLTSYAGNTQHNGGKNKLSFMPSQAEWSTTNLPQSTAMMEPFKACKDEVESLVSSTGEVVKDRNGHPLRAFDHILPANIPASVEGWLIATWVAEDPRIQWRDIEARMSTGDDKTVVRIRERYARYRDTIGALSRDATGSKRGPTKKDVKAVHQQSWERLAGNCWWHVDLETKRMCQSIHPLKAYAGKVAAVYPLPLSRTQNGEYSTRIHAAHQEPQRGVGVDSGEIEAPEAMP